MKLIKTAIIKSFFLVFLIMPGFVSAETTTVSEDVYRAQLLELIASLQQQILLLQEKLQAQRAGSIQSTAGLSEGGALSRSVDMVARYSISTPDDTNNILDREHREYFERMFALYPDRYDGYIGRVGVYDAESSDFDAFVETLPPLHEKWLYAVSERMLEDIESDWNTELIIHELAHIVSYEVPGGAARMIGQNCASYFDQSGCPVDDSYLDQYVDAFWDTSDLRRVTYFVGQNDGYETAYEYYDEHKTEYVSEYATIAPEEDFAESFRYFMLEEIPTGKLAKQKVAFFGQFGELLSMQREIREEK
jgi:hypothetical protein